MGVTTIDEVGGILNISAPLRSGMRARVHSLV